MADRGAGRRRREGEAEALGNATTNQTKARCEVEVCERWRHGKRSTQPAKRQGRDEGGRCDEWRTGALGRGDEREKLRR